METIHKHPSDGLPLRQLNRCSDSPGPTPAIGRLPHLLRYRPLALSATVLATACGGGGGGGSGSSGPAAPPPPTPIPLVDSIPAAGVTVGPATSSVHVVHVADADWSFEYSGTCEPTGIALRRTLIDLGGPDDGREVVDHRLACTLEPGTDHEVHVDATAGDGSRHRAVLEFSSAAERAATGVEVSAAAGLSRSSVDRLFEQYAREAVLQEVDTPIVGTLVALLVAEIAERAWTELGGREAAWGTLSASVSYPSRSPSGAAATLSGLVAVPDVVGASDYVAPDRIVVLAHATGSTPSRLRPSDGTVVLANLIAGRGYLVVAPDNWGRGHGDGADEPETYLMANRVAANGLDMVRAVLDDARYAVFHNAPDTAEVAIAGYSQGAHSAVALWLAGASISDGVAVREVYAGGGPHGLYRSFRGVLERLAGRCDGNPWCREVDRNVMVPYAVGRILPAFLRYTDVGLAPEDVLDGERLSEAFVTGMLDGDERFDALKTMLQLNSFPNALEPAGSLPDTDARILLYHSPFDRLLPQRNTADLAEALFPGFDVTADLEACSSRTFEELGELVDMAGVVHTICAFEVFDRVLRDLREGEAARTGYHRAAARSLEPATPWRDLAERRAATALADSAGLAAFRATKSSAALRTLSRRLRAADSPALQELADRLWREPR